MRRFLVGGLLMLCALVARAGDSPALSILPEGGWASREGNFRVVFRFADLKAVPAAAKKLPQMMLAPAHVSPAGEWSGAQGVFARLEFCCVDRSIGLGRGTLAAARLRLTNPSARPFHTTLSVALSPEGAIRALAFDRHAFLIEGKPVLVADTPSRGGILAASPFASRPLTPQDHAHVESAQGECRGEMLFDLMLAPGQTQTLGFICPVHLAKGAAPDLEFYRALSVEALFTQAEKDATAR